MGRSVSGFGIVGFGIAGFEMDGVARSGFELGGGVGVEIDPGGESGTVVAVLAIEAFELALMARAKPG